jgi:hypothetical protein
VGSDDEEADLGDIRKRYDARFKAKMALEAIRGERTLANVDLNVHIQDGTPLEKHARINLYVPSKVGKGAPPNQAGLVRIQAELDEMTIERGMAAVAQSVTKASEVKEDILLSSR